MKMERFVRYHFCVSVCVNENVCVNVYSCVSTSATVSYGEQRKTSDVGSYLLPYLKQSLMFTAVYSRLAGYRLPRIFLSVSHLAVGVLGL